jgi:hypothetical protein
VILLNPAFVCRHRHQVDIPIDCFFLQLLKQLGVGIKFFFAFL